MYLDRLKTTVIYIHPPHHFRAIGFLLHESISVSHRIIYIYNYIHYKFYSKSQHEFIRLSHRVLNIYNYFYIRAAGFF